MLKPSAPSSTQSPSLFGRLSRMISGASSEAPTEGGTDAVEAKKSSTSSKRSYGFATKNLMLHNDKSSEDLYRYKNFSSEHMRSSSPKREEDESANASNTGTFAIENRDDDNNDDDDTTEKSAKLSKHQDRKKK